MRTLCSFASALAVLSLVACSPKTEKKAENQPASNATNRAAALGAAVNRHGNYKEVAEVPEDLQRKAEAFARKFEADIRSQNLQNVRSAINRREIVEAVFEGIAPSDKAEKFKEGLERGMQNGAVQLAKTFAAMEPKFKHLVIYKGEPAARFRFVSESAGISLVDFVLRTDRIGEISIPNLCNHAMGYDMVEQSRRTIAPIIAELDRGFVERLFNKPNLGANDLKAFGELQKASSSGDMSGVVAAYKALPVSLRDSMAATALYISALQQGEDMEACKQALKDAGNRFKSANFDLMLVDVYALDKDYGKAADCLDTFMGAVEKDAALMALKSLMLCQKGDIAAANTVLREAMKMEPDCAYVHSKGLDVLLAAKDFKAVHDSMIFLEKQAGYSFKDNMEDPAWDEFKKAPESEPWR